jgi:hypothetical protein
MIIPEYCHLFFVEFRSRWDLFLFRSALKNVVEDQWLATESTTTTESTRTAESTSAESTSAEEAV